MLIESILISLKHDDGYDFFWYLGIGNIMHGTRNLPTPFTIENPQWLNHEWAFHWILGLSPEPSFFHFLLKITLIFTIIFSLYLTILKRLPNSQFFSVFLASIVGILSETFFVLRAQLIGYLLSIITWTILTSELSEKYKFGILVPLFTIWANCHGSFILGLCLVIYYQAFNIIQAICKKETIKYSGLLLFAALTFACAINPYGIKIFTYPYKWLGNEIYKQYIREWTSVVGWHSLLYPYLIFTFVSLPLIISGKPLKLAEIVLYGIFMILPLTAVRHLPFYYLFSILPISDALYNLSYKFERFNNALAISKNWLWGLILASIILFQASILYKNPVTRIPDTLFQKYIYPTGAVAFMRENDLNGRILNSYQWGGYLWREGFNIFIDGRLDTLYPESVFRDYTDIVTLEPNWKDKINKWKIDFVLFDTTIANQTPKINNALIQDEEWMILYQDPVSTLFARKSSLYSDFISRFQSGEIPIPDEPMSQYAAGLTLMRRDAPSADIERYLRRAIELDPLFPQPHLELAKLLIKEKKYDLALTEIKKAAKLGIRGNEIDDLLLIASQNLKK